MKITSKCVGTMLVIAAALLPGTALAYPIPPVSLWQLVEQADSVVVARVERVEMAEGEPPSAEAPLDRDVAVLRVLETWKGEAVREVRVSFCARMICPAPPRFEPGEVVLAFLESGETQVRRWRALTAAEEERVRNRTSEEIAQEESEGDGEDPPTAEEKAALAAHEAESIRRYEEYAAGRWFAVGLSYGTLYPDEGDLGVYRELVSQAARLQAAGEVARADRREWLLAAAERRATRWQGLYELAPAADALHYFYDSERRDAKAEPLTGEDLARLARGFVREPSADSTLTMLLTLLAPYPDLEVDRAAAAAIETALRDRGRAWWLPEAMVRTLERFGDRDPERRVRREKIDCDGAPTCEWVSVDDLPAIWEQARRELGIPAVEAVKVPARRVGRVGGETPD